jgi:hypothetical protein
MATAIPFSGWQSGDANGAPASGGKIYFYVVGTTTPQNTYSDSALTTPNTNPVVMDASGWPGQIYLSSELAYDYIVKSADDATTYVARTTIPANVSGAQPVDATLTAIAGLVLADGDIIEGTGTDTVRAIKRWRDSYAEMQAITTMQANDVCHVTYRTTAGDGGGGVFRYTTDDMSGTFIRSTTSILTGEIDAGTDVITKTAHGFRTGQGCLVTGGDGLTANTVVYYIRRVSANTLTLHATYDGAIADTGGVDITGTTGFDLKTLVDPDQGAYVLKTGAAPDGSEGGFVRTELESEKVWRVEWFSGSGSDDTAQITKAALAGGVGATIIFPARTLTFSDPDGDGTGLYVLSGQAWMGIDRKKSVVKLSSSVTSITRGIKVIDGAVDFTIRNMTFDGNRDNITPAVDLYSYFNMVVGPDGGSGALYQGFDIKNS